LQGCPLSVALINMLTSVWKKLIGTLRGGFAIHGTGATRLPTVELNPEPADELLVDTTGYADDTYLLAANPVELQKGLEATEKFLQLTDQAVNPKKSLHACLRGGTARVKICGADIPIKTEFRCLGAAVRLHKSPKTGPLLAGRIEKAIALAERVAMLPGGFERKVSVLSSLCIPSGLHAVEVGATSKTDLRRMETSFLKAMWRSARGARAKEVIFTVLSPGHRVSPCLVVDYQRILWLAKWSRTPGPQRLAIHAIWQCQNCPSRSGPVGRALLTCRHLGWTCVAGW